ncbi:MAG: dTMP kinase [Candidatus Eisenbacteria bacterium]
MRGRFITFEGIEGSGKSTQVARLAAWLGDDDCDRLVTREPGGTGLGRRLRAVLLEGDSVARAREPLTEALLMVADRAEHVASVILPALDQGTVVLCDRHADSTLAYQGGGSGVALETLRALNGIATRGLVPDLTLLYDLEPAVALARMRARTGGAADRFEAESLAFHQRVRAAYLALAQAEPGRFAVIDAARPADSVFADTRARVAALLGRPATP